MAETKDDIDLVDENNGKSKKLIIIIAAAVLIVGGAAAAFFMMGDSTEQAETASAEPIKQAPIYHAVDKPFIVNFSNQSKGAVGYLQIKLKVMARDKAALDAFKLHTPAIKHELLMLYFSQNYDTLNTREGTEALRQQTLETANKILKDEQHTNLLEAVYFTSLIMQ